MKIDWKEEKIDILQIHTETMEALAGMYALAKVFHGENFLQASPRKHRKVRKHIEKNYAEWIRNQIGGIAAYFDDEENDTELLLFLEQCYKEQESRGITNRRLFEEGTKHLPEKTAAALWNLAVETHYIYGLNKDHTLLFDLHDNCAFRSTLVLSNVTGFPTRPDLPDGQQISESGNIGIEFYDITVGENDYSITGDIIFYEEYDLPSSKVTLNFTDVYLETEAYCATDELFSENPWQPLGYIALNIYQKSLLTDLPCNEKEHALLPLLAEIASITHIWSLLETQACSTLPQLTSLVKQYGYEKLLPKIAAVEKEKPFTSKHNARTEQLIQALCEQAYEPMWRDIFSRVQESQKDYPSKVSLRCPADILESTRTSIQELMQQHGYTGTYPDFVQYGPLRGIHLEESYDMTYFVGMEKAVTYRIHCSEEVDESNYLTIQFLCGTALNQKGKTCDDIYSCLFNANGKRLFHTMHHDYKLSASAEPSDYTAYILEPEVRPDDLEKCVQIAVKKNHLQRLTKEERKLYHDIGAESLAGLFFIIFIVGGVLFGAAMTVGFMLIEFLSALIFGQLHLFPELFMDTPWWLMFLFCSLGYGLSMGLLTVLAKKK